MKKVARTFGAISCARSAESGSERLVWRHCFCPLARLLARFDARLGDRAAVLEAIRYCPPLQPINSVRAAPSALPRGSYLIWKRLCGAPQRAGASPDNSALPECWPCAYRLCSRSSPVRPQLSPRPAPGIAAAAMPPLRAAPWRSSRPSTAGPCRATCRQCRPVALRLFR